MSSFVLIIMLTVAAWADGKVRTLHPRLPTWKNADCYHTTNCLASTLRIPAVARLSWAPRQRVPDASADRKASGRHEVATFAQATLQASSGQEEDTKGFDLVEMRSKQGCLLFRTMINEFAFTGETIGEEYLSDLLVLTYGQNNSRGYG
eukprot:gnl/TRDRNA2_/TRDRNA2_73890_c0_seq2.p1 gnl/TRDRNA2_/TRDRNA2_73890_c0~~gnl/TRDRNA2_/TRDRNA2_73890_c0_seq2.p1  ORF type:complete len:168 (-),score=20.94 gnl/TRDRNA2_/TRDRNA2_73890_c0_seq2:61-507(-)